MLVGRRRACCDFFADATWRCGPFLHVVRPTRSYSNLLRGITPEQVGELLPDAYYCICCTEGVCVV